MFLGSICFHSRVRTVRVISIHEVQDPLGYTVKCKVLVLLSSLLNYARPFSSYI